MPTPRTEEHTMDLTTDTAATIAGPLFRIGYVFDGAVSFIDEGTATPADRRALFARIEAAGLRWTEAGATGNGWYCLARSNSQAIR